MEIPTRNTAVGAGSSSAPRNGLVVSSGPAVEISAKGRDKPIVRHLPNVKPKIPLLGVSRTDIPLQRTSNSSKSTVEGQVQLASQAGGPHLAKKALSGCTRQKLKKARVRASEVERGAFSNQEMQVCPSREKPQPKPQRGQGQRAVPTQKWPELQKCPGTYKEALTNIKIAIFKETYREDKLNEDDQNYILEELGKVLHRTPIGELSHVMSYRLKGGAVIYRCADQQFHCNYKSQVKFSSHSLITFFAISAAANFKDLTRFSSNYCSILPATLLLLLLLS
jgi:hypothetical protein